MYGLHPDLGVSGIIFVLVLEVLFLAGSAVMIGLGCAEIKKRGRYAKNGLTILIGISIAGLSLYATKILLDG